MTRRRSVLGALLVGLLAVAAPSACMAPAAGVEVTEDSPGWDCRTQGNRVCEVPTAEGGRALVLHDIKGRPVASGLLPGAYVEEWPEVDGHRDCVALIGPTSYATCADGFFTAS